MSTIPAAAAATRKAGRPANPGARRVVCNLPGKLSEAMDRYVSEVRPHPSVTNILVTALEDFLHSKGFWPPPSSE